MTGIRYFHYDRFDHRQVKARGHAIVEQSCVPQDPTVVVEILLVEAPSDPLRRSALHLALYVARMNRLAGILGDRAAEHLDFARIGINFDVDASGCESGPDPA